MVGQLLIYCCICILFAISSQLVCILLFWLVMQSNDGVSKFLNTFLFISFGSIFYSFIYIDKAYLIHFLVYLLVIFLACIFVVLANVARSFIHPFLSRLSFGGGCMLMWMNQ